MSNIKVIYRFIVKAKSKMNQASILKSYCSHLRSIRIILRSIVDVNHPFHCNDDIQKHRCCCCLDHLGSPGWWQPPLHRTHGRGHGHHIRHQDHAGQARQERCEYQLYFYTFLTAIFRQVVFNRAGHAERENTAATTWPCFWAKNC